MDTLIKTFFESKVIVVCRGVQKEQITPVAKALHDGGIHFMEIPFDQKNVQTNKDVAEMIHAVRSEMGEEMYVGAGTVCTSEQLNLAKEAGAQIMVAPNLDEELIVRAKEAGLACMPGCATPSEMLRAHKLGADMIKLFPASMITLKTIKEITVPLNHLRLVSFGGVTAENFQQMLDAGLFGVGVGSAILNKEALSKGDFSQISHLAKAFTVQLPR